MSNKYIYKISQRVLFWYYNSIKFRGAGDNCRVRRDKLGDQIIELDQSEL